MGSSLKDNMILQIDEKPYQENNLPEKAAFNTFGQKDNLIDKRKKVQMHSSEMQIDNHLM